MPWELLEQEAWLNDCLPGDNPPQQMVFRPFAVELNKTEFDAYEGIRVGINDIIQTIGWTRFEAKIMSKLADAGVGGLSNQHNRSFWPDLGIYPRDSPPDWLDHDVVDEAESTQEEILPTASFGSGRTGKCNAVDEVLPFVRVSWGWVEVLINVKLKAQGRRADPSGTEAFDRSQIADYANAVFNCQHRQFFFMITIVNDQAHLVRFDRRGATMMEEFNYIDNPGVLGTFLYRLSKLPPSGRGYDPSVSPANEDETTLFRSLHAEVRFGGPHTVRSQGLLDAASTGWRIHKMTVHAPFSSDEKSVRRDSPMSCREFLVGKPAFVKGSLVGRGTRGLVAYDITHDTVVFIKDSWRPDSDDIRPEYDTYIAIREKMGNRQVFIPTLLGGGDVLWNDELQRTHTLTDRYLPSIHFRLILKEVCRPLEKFNNSYQLLRAVFCAFFAHRLIWEQCKLLHRDVSVGNILIYHPMDSMDPDELVIEGLLADWDLARTEDEIAKQDATQPTRSGTWPFMSARLQQFPDERHELADDLESFAHVLNWSALKYLPNSKSRDRNVLASYMSLIYDTAVPYRSSGIGSREKFDMVKAGDPFVVRIVWHHRGTHPLQSVLDQLSRLCALHYRHVKPPEIPLPTPPTFGFRSVGSTDYLQGVTSAEFPAKSQRNNVPASSPAANDTLPPDPGSSPLRDHTAIYDVLHETVLGKIGVNTKWPIYERTKARQSTLSMRRMDSSSTSNMSGSKRGRSGDPRHTRIEYA